MLEFSSALKYSETTTEEYQKKNFSVESWKEQRTFPVIKPHNVHDKNN